MFRIIRDKETWGRYTNQIYSKTAYAGFDYIKLAQQLEATGTAEAAVFEKGGDFCFHPYIRREIHLNPEWYDLVSAYDFGGFWFSTDNLPRIKTLISGFTTAFARYCADQKIISEFIRFFPFGHIPDTGYYEVIKVADNVIVDLGKKPENRFASYPGSLRRNLRKARASGFCLSFDVSLKEFMGLYYGNLDGLDSQSYYYFPESFLSGLKEIEIVGARDASSRLCAVQVYLLDNDRAFYYLGASDRNRLTNRPNDYLFDAMMSHLSTRGGISTLHLGGGADSLIRFKQKFSSMSVSYYIGKKVFDRQKYQQLVKKQEQSLNINLTPISFFPTYRYANE